MKNVLKHTVIALLLLCISVGMNAQTSNTSTTTKKTTTSKTKTTQKAKKPAPKGVAPGKEVTITIKNGCEKTVAIYTGPKTGLRNPKVKTIGGHGVDKFYVHINEVVCLMKADGKTPQDCKDVKAAGNMEVNESGTNLALK